MLYTYTEKQVGGMMIWDQSGHFYVEDLHIDGKLISIRQRVKDSATSIKVFDKARTVKIISSVELEWHKHETDNYYFPVEVKTP